MFIVIRQAQLQPIDGEPVIKTLTMSECSNSAVRYLNKLTIACIRIFTATLNFGAPNCSFQQARVDGVNVLELW